MYPLFELPRKLLRAVSCWPDDILWPLKRKILVSILLISHAFAITFEFKYAVEQFRDPFEVFDAVNPAIEQLLTLFKVCILIYYRKEFKYNHDRIRSYFDREYHGTYYDIVLKAKRSAFRYCFFNFTGASVVSACFILRPLANNAVQFFTNGNYTLDLPLKASLPQHLIKGPGYEFNYAVFTFSAIFTSTACTAIDGLIMAYCEYLAAQFDIISYQLQTHFDMDMDETCQIFSEKETALFSEKFHSVVKMHCELINRLKEISKIIWPIILAQFIPASIIIGLSLLDFIKLKGFATMLYLLYAIVVLAQLLVYCIAGTCIESATQRMHESAYSIKWYRFNTKFRKELLIFMIISTKDRSLSVPFFTPSLATFRAIMTAALSYFTILQSFFKD